MMKTSMYKSTGIMLILMSLFLATTQCSEGEGLDQFTVLDNELPGINALSQQLTDGEIKGILFLREEEKLARDVYLYLYEIYPLRPFSNISESEQAHMDAIKYLIDKYNLEDPVGDNPEGSFQNGDLQQMYLQLIEMGSASEVDALKVGALIEEIDIIDLQHELDSIAENVDVVRVYQNLCNASGNHLQAFVRVLGTYNLDYMPVKLDVDEFNNILGN